MSVFEILSLGINFLMLIVAIITLYVMLRRK
ncbi:MULTISPECIES: putative holin-like toxin [unclassified Veillonella]|nr:MULTISPECIES: putative holin-like toxin [unclassified Veillonella]